MPDVVASSYQRNATHEGVIVKLEADKKLHTHRGLIKHDDIIGKEVRQLVQSTRGDSYRIHEPTLAEYVRLTPRIVTPIYPSDTNLIVSLLDIHVDTPSGTSTGAPLEILEAGTGHGALTLHLSRAVHAANPPIPRLISYASTEDIEDPVYEGETVSDLQDISLETWKRNRRAIVHTLDISSKHSKHAEKIVSGFRKGMYAGNVDFHVGDVSLWIAEQKASRGTEEPFLSHVFLDLPNADSHLANVAPVLHVNGMLAVFNPSITQIVDCVEAIRKHRMPYLLDQVIELGAGTIREWDVRAVRPRATLKKAEVEQEQPSQSEGPIDPGEGQDARDDELAEDLAKAEEKWAIVCRPKAGQQVVGGGFLGLWRRMEKAPVQEAQAGA
ncbi:S-adenosyl-L-methionine-dependent methyltransferase [Byssothecium circinans]|uniref:tRNA (adenine(58)-N(1))-methyltransferase catalytic subunit TRM61 n=1 Tax=Byssothecium circinans TaxID=147558 RepID=A0A6A5U0A1_9PLEO|nr:S-adenosyl-L-methionine-dependent methyltransferase [Byssothecium circinans]